MKEIKWGIIGCGNIAHHFANDLKLVNGARLYGAASRSLEKAQSFSAAEGFEKAYGSYEELIDDAAVDVLYIATPHNSHKQWSIRAMNARKHVLCEKPLGVNAREVHEMIACAQKNGVFFMEALWTRFMPAIMDAKSRIEEGAIGSLKYINADFTFRTKSDEHSRVINPKLAGGALLDVAIYPVFLSYLLLGKPKEIVALSNFHRLGSDMQTGAILKYDEQIVNIMGGFETTCDMKAKVYGTDGSIVLDPRWHETEGFLLKTKESETHISLPKIGKGYAHEILEVHQCLQAKQLESLMWSHKDSLNLIGILDSIREKIGLKYPFEN